MARRRHRSAPPGPGPSWSPPSTGRLALAFPLLVLRYVLVPVWYAGWFVVLLHRAAGKGNRYSLGILAVVYAILGYGYMMYEASGLG
jgi:hypothetical protein